MKAIQFIIEIWEQQFERINSWYGYVKYNGVWFLILVNIIESLPYELSKDGNSYEHGFYDVYEFPKHVHNVHE